MLLPEKWEKQDLKSLLLPRVVRSIGTDAVDPLEGLGRTPED